MKYFQPAVVAFICCVVCFFSIAQAAEEQSLTVEAVECRGNTQTSCKFIQRKLRLQADSRVGDAQVQDAQLRLSALPIFASVRVYLERGSERGRARLIVEVVEADRVLTEVSARYDYGSIEGNNGLDSTSHSGAVTGRISHQNLFGMQKIGALSINAGLSTADQSSNGYVRTESSSDSLSAAVIYLDPNLVGTEHFFLSFTAGYSSSEQTSDSFSGIFGVALASTESDRSSVSGAISLGYRLWSYSYLFGRYSHQEQDSTFWQTSPSRGVGRQDIESTTKTWMTGLGWNSEDDAYFPTRGILATAIASSTSIDVSAPTTCPTCDQVDWSVAYKQTIALGHDSFLTLRLGQNPVGVDDQLRPLDGSLRGDVGLTFSRNIGAGSSRRARWYAHIGAGPVDLSTRHDGNLADQAYLAIGVLFESRIFGLVSLSAQGSRTWFE